MCSLIFLWHGLQCATVYIRQIHSFSFCVYLSRLRSFWLWPPSDTTYLIWYELLLTLCALPICVHLLVARTCIRVDLHLFGSHRHTTEANNKRTKKKTIWRREKKAFLKREKLKQFEVPRNRLPPKWVCKHNQTEIFRGCRGWAFFCTLHEWCLIYAGPLGFRFELTTLWKWK